MNTIAAIGFFILFGMFIVSCAQQVPVDDTKETAISEYETSQGLKKFSSEKELADFLEKTQQNEGYSGYYSRSGFIAAAEMAVGAPMVKSAATDSGVSAGASDYSQTNIQVAGVDEADFVKNDGRYIYT